MPKPQTTAYLRVSTVDQDLEKNKYDILQLANEKGLTRVQWVEETVSGRVSWKKRKIAEVIENAQPGDSLIVSELSRLGRSMLECMRILSIATQKGLRIYAVKGNWQLDELDPIETLHKNGATQKHIAKRYGTTEANLSRWMKRHNLERSA